MILRAWARAVAVAAAVIAADLVTKELVRAHVERGSRDSVFFFVDLVHVKNRGVAFGLLAEGRLLVFALIGAALVLLLVYFGLHPRRPLLWLPTGLLLGGALGNLLDRLRFDEVTDFIDLPLWPAFNLADVAITAGVLALLYVLEAGRGEDSDDDAPRPA